MENRILAASNDSRWSRSVKNKCADHSSILTVQDFGRHVVFDIDMQLIITQKNGLRHTVLYSEQDHDLVSQYRWAVCKKGEDFYVRASVYKPEKKGSIGVYMHRLILGITNPKIKGDHKDHNTLDNRRHNLRIATHAENMRNTRPGGKSKYLGVHFYSAMKNGKKYGPYIVSRIMVDRKVLYLGQFKTEEAAAKAHDVAAKVHHKEFAYLNFPDE